MRATLTFFRFMAQTPQADIAGTGTGNLDYESLGVDVFDADAQTPPPTLASHGFQAVPFSCARPEAGLTPEFKRQFAKACAAAVRQQTGAALVTVLPGTVLLRRTDGAKSEAPLFVSHNDFTPGSATLRADRLSAAAGGRKPTRYAAFNAWWLARPGPQDRPLALCDANTIAPSDLQYGQVKVLNPDKSVLDFGEIAYQRYNPRHRWYWYPRLGPGRLLLFCGFDSDPTRPSMVTHCAFANPACPPDAPPRVSVECRLMAFW